MQRWFIGFVCLFMNFQFANSQARISAIFDKTLYYDGNLTPYYDLYLWIDGNSVTYLPISSDSSKAEVDVMLVGAKTDSVLFYDRFTLIGKKAQQDSSRNAGQLVYLNSIVARQDQFVFELHLADLNDKSNAIVVYDTVDLRLDPNKITFSQIEFVKPVKKSEETSIFNKYGYDIIPRSDYFDEHSHRLDFFVEMYNTHRIFGENEPFLLKFYIQNYNNRKQLARYTFSKKQTAKPANPYIGSLDISDLPAGHYLLVTEIRDKDAKLVSKQTRYFERENNINLFTDNNFINTNVDNTFVSQINDPNELREDILSLQPISGIAEFRYATNVVKNGDLNLMKRFLYSFWVEYDAENPYDAYLHYKKQVAAVNEEFSSGGQKGYKTDRGRVYLQYGPPIARVKRYHEPANYPYEIWQYDKVDVQTNVRFIFYNQDAMASNNFILLHSDLRGEINNRQWEMYLSKQSRPAFGIDDNTYGNSQFGNRARDFYNNPR